MLYKKYQNLNLSALGMGAMRLPTLGTERNTLIDEAAVGKMVDYAIEHGVNYFDTAWGYHDGQSEIVIGKALSKYPREQWHLADKFPGYDLSNMDKVATIFEKQLEKCSVKYFDFYLFHNVCEMNIDAYLDEKYGIFNYLIKQKESGRIRHLGFSVHGSYNVMKRFLESYGNKMEFCQIQLNYVDWHFQNAKGKVELLREYNIPVFVMEPMRGGMLALLSEEHTIALKALRPEESIPAWSLRFLQAFPDVVVTLSGSSNLGQLKENILVFCEDSPVSKSEMDTLLGIAEKLVQKKSLPCTACNYCTNYCPQQLDIPNLLALYNEHNFTGGGFRAPMALMAIPNEKHPNACIACKKCEAVCPQQLKISDAMADFAAML